MNDYISRQTVMKEFADFVRRANNSDFAPTPTWNDAVSLVGSTPAADVAPVVHGRWINICGDRESPRQCSECIQDFDYIDGICYLVSGQRLPQYCPNCGARMDGDADAD